MLIVDVIVSIAIFLLPILVIIAIFRYLSRGEPPRPMSPLPPMQQQVAIPVDRDNEWRSYLESFRAGDGLSKAQESLLDKILNSPAAPDAATMQAAYSVSSQADDMAVPLPPPKPVQELDSTLLLLYFGAFLFVTAAGLFVAFSGLSGGLRTLLVIAVMLVMYFAGFWLHERSRRLRPAGVAFTAIGMAIAPLVGVTAYHFVTNNQYGPFIWLLTSAMSFAMYLYALMRLQSTFISYLVVFSFLSLFESAVGVTGAATYYYVWAFIIAGLLLRAVGFVRESPAVGQAAAQSAQVIIPLSLLVSLAMVAGNGTGQLAISLILSAVYYTFEALRPGAENQRQGMAVAAQVLYIAGLSIGIYTISKSAVWVATELIGIGVAQALVIEFWHRQNAYLRNFASVAYLSGIAAIPLSYHNGTLMAAAFVLLVLIGILAAYRQRRAEMYGGAAVAWVALPYIIGQIACNPSWSLNVQSIACLIPLLTTWYAWLWIRQKQVAGDWPTVTSSVYILAGVAALLPAFVDAGWLNIIVGFVFALTLAQAARQGAGSDLWTAAGIVIILPVLRELGATNELIFPVALGVALVSNISLSLLSRTEWNRWFVTILGLMVPVGVGAGGLHFTLNTTGYAYMYVLVLLCLLFCRTVARGVYLLSSKAPIASLYHSASLSYVFGYVMAAILAVVISLVTPRSQLHTSLILGLLIVLTPYIAIVVEKRKSILGLIPWLLMALLASLVRPSVGRADGSLVLLTASTLAVLAYVTVESYRSYLAESYMEVMQATVMLAYAPLLLALWYQSVHSVPPILLGIAGLITLHFYWERKQSEREVSGGVIVLAFLWLISTLGVHNPQAYTHIVAAVFALYAYWRFCRGEREVSDQYLYAMLGTATIPLALQAIGGTAGDAYGWWLLLEQVGFMLIGISIGRSFVIRWGLYVAIGAVLYQLRNLGWAALSFLALFIIGMALWRLLKSNEHHDQQ